MTVGRQPEGASVTLLHSQPRVESGEEAPVRQDLDALEPVRLGDARHDHPWNSRVRVGKRSQPFDVGAGDLLLRLDLDRQPQLAVSLEDQVDLRSVMRSPKEGVLRETVRRFHLRRFAMSRVETQVRRSLGASVERVVV